MSGAKFQVFVERAIGLSDLKRIVAVVSELEVSEIGGDPVSSLISSSLLALDEGCVAKSKVRSQSALDVCWEKLNSGYWRDVPLTWRTLYSLSAVAKCLSEIAEEEHKSALRTCDLGLLMGAPLADPYLPRLAACLSNYLRESSPGVASSPVLPCPTLPDFSCQGLQVSCVHCPSLESFESNYMSTQTPVIIVGAVDHWPALTSRQWSIQYLKEVAGNRTVPIEIGSRYTDASWSQKLMTISTFVDTISECESVVCDNKDDDQPSVLYLAQHQLFDQLPELRADICIPDYCCLSKEEEEEPIVNAWIGPRGTVSPLHHDPYHNVFAQVVGRKVIRLYSPAHSDMLYPHDSVMLNNTSQVDCEHPDLERFPRFSEAPFWECVVGPGDLLYIPPKFWHYVRSLAVSFSVSFWWN